ncbi:SacI homology domain-containing protein [Flagelloscypha sp. PMI_526]|nr:SacI homology domain-containing protein [Flagelloscypha sp. PMI_526]
MRKFLQKASKSFALPSKPSNASTGTTGLQPKFMVPPVPHPYPWEHIALLVTDDALCIRPHFSDNNASSQSLTYIRIPFVKGADVEELSATNSDGLDWSSSVVAYGILGLLELFTASYLLVITSRAEIGHHLDPTHVVYNLKSITPIPLVPDKARMAVNTIASRNITLTRPPPLRSTTEDVLTPEPSNSNVDKAPWPDPTSSTTPRVQFSTEDAVRVITPVKADTEHGLYASNSAASSTSDVISIASEGSEAISPIAKTIAERLSFWNRIPKRTPVPTSNVKSEPPLAPVSARKLESIINEQEPIQELEEKIVREIIREFTKGGMYFSYTFDITRSVQHKKELLAKSEKQNGILADLNALPSDNHINAASEHPAPAGGMLLDRQFWWNEWLIRPFVDAGLHPYVIPVMQGYYQIAQFVIPSESPESEEETSVDYTIVSRRSRDRAGLRYQRRGIDDEAHVANFVETETIVHVKRADVDNVFSFMQIRGSIPLFWTQTGYGLKPPPILSTDRTFEQSLEVMKKHFARTVVSYGPHQCVNLAEQHGKEGVVTEAYRKGAEQLNNPDVKYHEYDFHVETRGMKYENIAKLLTSMEKTFEEQGFLWIANNNLMTEQKGVFRTNCIDCLDRTNVVQSSFARYILMKQLSGVGIANPNIGRIDLVFNDVWANNGDAISRAYAGTSALKGDFTRTGKRDLTGLLNDGVNSLARMYSSTFSDWFSQAVIDFMLGSRTVAVFSEFLHRLQSSDPRDLIRLSKIRAEAVATSVARVLPEEERLLNGWTLFGPEDLNVKLSDRFEEKVLLLSAKAMYIIRYDYSLEKVKSYTRVPLGDITGITAGSYILSPLEEASRDPVQNAGFILTWLNMNQVTRVTSYSIRNTVEPRLSGLQAKLPASTSFAAFKALPVDPAHLRRAGSSFSYSNDHGADTLSNATTCKEAVELIVESIQQFVKWGDVVGLQEAQKMTTMYAKMEYGIKRLLWLGG